MPAPNFLRHPPATAPASLLPACIEEARHTAHSVLRRQGVAVNPRSVRAIDIAAEAAATEGFEFGEQSGYTSGWRWGLFCGVFVGAAACAILVFLGYQAGTLQ